MVNKIIVNNIYSKISNIYNVIYLKIRLKLTKIYVSVTLKIIISNQWMKNH